MKRTLKRILGPIIVALTIGAFVWYLQTHPEVLQQLVRTPLPAVFAILGLYLLSIIALAVILAISLRYFGRRMPAQENFLLTAYSSLVNFFGPGQSGPGVRAMYLKLKHGVTIKQYAFVTLVYYAWFAVISGILLGITILSWWQSLILAGLIAGFSTFVIRKMARKSASSASPNTKTSQFMRLTLLLGAATFVQVLVVVIAYFIELRVVDDSVNFMQALSYTGAANFALFVSLTPGAIGFREAFLVFSENIHGISQQTVLAASVLDRALYLVFLGLLFLVVLSMHAGQKLQIKKLQQASDQAGTSKS